MLSIILCSCFIQPGQITSQASEAVSHSTAIEPRRYEPVKGSPVADFPYERYTTLDGLGRTITFYVSKGDSTKSLPLVVCVQGSGSQSTFLEVETPTGKRIASGGPEAVVLSQFRESVRVLAVEKPGVEFLKQPKRPGSAEEGSEEFKREHTLPRWVEAIHASIQAASGLPGVNSKRILALGHSEGGQVVCHVSEADKMVTHVATLAGGGPTQLFDLIDLARSGAMGDPTAKPEDRVAMIVSGWKKVLDHPDATDMMFLGHPHRRWSSFLADSPSRALLASKVPVFIAQGAKDANSSPAAADMLYAELLAHGRSVTYERVESGDHGFMKPGDNGAGWKETIRKAVEWFLKS